MTVRMLTFPPKTKTTALCFLLIMTTTMMMMMKITPVNSFQISKTKVYSNNNNNQNKNILQNKNHLVYFGKTRVVKTTSATNKISLFLSNDNNANINDDTNDNDNNNNNKITMKELPDNVVNYSTVPVLDPCFTADTIPPGLLKNHSTRDGTWGVIRILKGRLEYTIGQSNNNANNDGGTKYELTPDFPGIIEPTILHSVRALTDDVEFQVEFYRQENTGPVNEPREGL